jgi:hypothetical protein
MASPTLQDWDIIIGGIIGTIIASAGTIYGIWERHTTNKRERKLNDRELEIKEREQKIKEREHEWKEKEYTQKEIDTLSQLRKDPSMSVQRHLLYDAYYEFMNTQSKEIFDSVAYYSAVHNIVEEMEGLGRRLRGMGGIPPIPLEHFSESDWKVIVYCYEAIKLYNEEYKDRNYDNDYYGEDYRYLVDRAIEYWQKKDPKRTLKPPIRRLSD